VALGVLAIVILGGLTARRRDRHKADRRLEHHRRVRGRPGATSCPTSWSS
jgi:hypothetical protein